MGPAHLHTPPPEIRCPFTVGRAKLPFPLRKGNGGACMLLQETTETHSSGSCLENPWTEEPGRLQSMELERVGND